MRKAFPKLIFFVVLAVMCGVCLESFAQLRVPPTHVAALASQSQSNDNTLTVQETETVTIESQITAPVTPIQHIVPTQVPKAQTQASPQFQAEVTMPTPAPLSMMAANPQIQPQLQMALPQQTATPGMMPGAIIVPVTVPQYMTYTPQPVTMMVNRPAQLVIPPYPTSMMQQPMMPMQQPMYDPMVMQMMQQQMMMQQMMPQAMMPPQQPQQPIPVKMILPDGSTVSIKHYMPGKFFRNVFRAVTP